MASFSMKRFWADRAGNFAITTALLLPVVIGVGGIAMDVTNAVREKNDLQNIADAATLAAASKMSDKDISAAEAEAMAKKEMLGQYLANKKQEGMSDSDLAALEKDLQKNLSATATITPTGGSSKNFDINLTLTTNIALNGLTSVLGFTSMPVSVYSAAASARSGNALSMYLVLDESGSMKDNTTTVDPINPTKAVTKSYEGWHDCTNDWGKTYKCYGKYTKTTYVTNYVTKIAALKTAAGVMFTELQKAAAPDSTNTTVQENAAKQLIRIGAVSYTHETKPEQKPAWGTSAANTYVNNLPQVPDGGTDATGAMAVAYSDLQSLNPTESAQQKSKGNNSFARFIVLMTDGEMTGTSTKWNSTIDAKVRAACKQAKDDGITIFTVAFMAPDNGKSLLQACASNKESYYESEDMDDLVAAFGEIGHKAAKTQTRLTN